MRTAHRSFAGAAALAAAVSIPLLAAPPGAAQAPALGGELGKVDFRVSCASDVVEDFDRAVALLHHMMYQEARATFEAIAAADPRCAMAHWGVAQTLFQPLWPARPNVEQRTRGWEAVVRARELGPATERERALVHAVEAFFQEPEVEEWWPRIERWAAAMADAHQARPDDLEIAAFYGLSVLAAGQIADNQLAHNERAARVLQQVHEREPLHPGAIHYIIHADDATGRADEHLHVVHRYGEIAPEVPHALHMPSHIYVRLGDWPEVIRWNRASADAALDFPAPGGQVSLHHIHGLDYLLYAHLQRGEDRQAAAVLEEALSREPYQEDFASAFHLAIMPARFAVERRAWERARAIQPRQPGYLDWDRYVWAEGLSWYARGMGAVRTGDLATARESETRLVELRDAAEGAGERAFATYLEIDRLILSGWLAHAAGDPDEAVALLEEAAQIEGTVEKHPITPGALLPPYEALGELLAELDRPSEALRAYEASLDVWPKRYHSVLGAARAARAAGERERAAAHYRVLLDIVDEEASEREGVREARRFLRGES